VIFFEQPILTSPYTYPSRYWEFDAEGRPTNRMMETRRRAEFVAPVPRSKKKRAPYLMGATVRRYRSDILVLIDDDRDDPLNLIVEIKGYRGEGAREKASTMHNYWIPGVNNLGTHNDRRSNIPTAELEGVMREEDRDPIRAAVKAINYRGDEVMKVLESSCSVPAAIWVARPLFPSSTNATTR